MINETCPQCGASVPGGLNGCRQLYDQLSYEAFQNVRIASVITLAFDTYCMQHIEIFCVSAKSYAAHLTRLCVGLEYGGQSEVYAALQRWYHTNLTKPPVLLARGSLQIIHVQALDDVEQKREQIHHWAQNVWQAYASQHEIARRWVEEALQAASKSRGIQH